MLTQVCDHVLPIIAREEAIQALIVDDTSYPKKGRTTARGESGAQA